MLTQRATHIIRSLCTGFAMAFGQLLLQFRELLAHSSIGCLPLFRVNLRFNGLVNFCSNCLATRRADGIGPHRHGRQRRRCIVFRSHGLSERGRKRFPQRCKLGLRSFKLGREFRIGAGPLGIGLQSCGLPTPMLHIHMQSFKCRLRIG